MSEPSFLYVEDDMMSRRVMDLLITKKLGYSKLTVFEDSVDFLQRLRALSHVPDVIFLDIQMRPLDGFEMLKKLRQYPAYRKAKVIALTANVMAADVENLREAGFDGLIGKPILTDTFPELVQRILAGESVWFIS